MNIRTGRHIYDHTQCVCGDFHPLNDTMIAQPTVIVVGAGASKPYGYPLGRELIDEVIHVLYDPEAARLMEDAGFERVKIRSMIADLSRCSDSSIDTWLRYNSQYMGLGKLAISLAIAEHEKHSEDEPLFRGRPRWYELLWQSMSTSIEHIADNDLGIITFNYDRSLDHFLHTTLVRTFNLDATSAGALCQTKPFHCIHIHGQVGPLPWQDLADGRAYGNKITTSAMLRATAGHIHLIGDLPTTGKLSAAQQLLDSASRVVFLGFGYVDENMKALEIQKYVRNMKCQGTGFGLGARQVSDIRQRWPVVVASPEHDNVTFLREDFSLSGR